MVVRVRGALRAARAAAAEEVAWHTFLTDSELSERLPDWTWVPDGLEAYHRLRDFRAGSPGAGV